MTDRRLVLPQHQASPSEDGLGPLGVGPQARLLRELQRLLEDHDGVVRAVHLQEGDAVDDLEDRLEAPVGEAAQGDGALGGRDGRFRLALIEEEPHLQEAPQVDADPLLHRWGDFVEQRTGSAPFALPDQTEQGVRRGQRTPGGPVVGGRQHGDEVVQAAEHHEGPADEPVDLLPEHRGGP